jgi:sugar-specific transcriptional regulator TrmB
MNTASKPVSKQASDVFALLNKGQALSAQDIAEALGIVPQSVYRVVEKLAKLGMVERVEGYPVTYKALPAQTALNYYLQTVTQAYKQTFDFNTAPQVTATGPTLTLIKDREALLKRTALDARAAKESIDFIASGLEVPDDNILAHRKASTVGVKIRAIVQQNHKTTKEKLEKWQDIGTEVRYLPTIDMRIFIFDKHITYITSYDPAKKNSAFGVRFDYSPLALQMSELFSTNWQLASELPR